MTITNILIKTLNGEISEVTNKAALLEHGSKNKVLLQLLRELKLEGPLRREQEAAFQRIHEELSKIAKNIQSLNYALIKFFKPMAYVPSDIDLLVHSEHLKEMLTQLHYLGYKTTIVEPNCITLEGRTTIDLYTNPDAANIPYISGERLLKFVQIEEINDSEVKKLKPEAEAVVTLSHAIYKEQIITLNDYYTGRLFLDSESIKIAEELRVLDAIMYSLKLFKEIELALVELPMKIPIRDAIKLLASKVAKDSLSRKFLLHTCLKLRDWRTPMLIKSRLTRQTY